MPRVVPVIARLHALQLPHQVFARDAVFRILAPVQRHGGETVQIRPFFQPGEFLPPDDVERAEGRGGPEGDLRAAGYGRDGVAGGCSVAGCDVVHVLEAFGGEVGDGEGEDERADEGTVLGLQAGEVAG